MKIVFIRSIISILIFQITSNYDYFLLYIFLYKISYILLFSFFLIPIFQQIRYFKYFLIIPKYSYIYRGLIGKMPPYITHGLGYYLKWNNLICYEITQWCIVLTIKITGLIYYYNIVINLRNIRLGILTIFLVTLYYFIPNNIIIYYIFRKILDYFYVDNYNKYRALFIYAALYPNTSRILFLLSIKQNNTSFILLVLQNGMKYIPWTHLWFFLKSYINIIFYICYILTLIGYPLPRFSITIPLPRIYFRIPMSREIKITVSWINILLLHMNRFNWKSQCIIILILIIFLCT